MRAGPMMVRESPQSFLRPLANERSGVLELEGFGSLTQVRGQQVTRKFESPLKVLRRQVRPLSHR